VSEAHQIGADLVVAATAGFVAVAIWSAFAGRQSGGTRDHRFAVDRAVLLVVALLALDDLVGIVLFATGRRPTDALHLLYGVAVLGTAPIGWWLSGRSRSGPPPTRLRRDVWLLGTAVVLIGLELRLFMTA
jgi:hypothetical protein